MTVIVYSKPKCKGCDKLKLVLKANKIRFSEVDIEADAARKQEMIKKSKQSDVPVLDFRGKVMVGFRPVLLKKMGLEV